jgi:UDP-glucuronate decarboxylase
MELKKFILQNLSKIKVKKNSKILITGCSGFIAKYLIQVLLDILQKKIHIIGVDSVKSDYTHKNFIFYKKNLVKNNLKNIFKKNKITTVIHLAGIPTPSEYKKNPLGTVFLNAELTKNLLELSKESNSEFVYFSSSEIYGDPDKNNIPTKENYKGNVSSIGPRSCYDESKRLGETYCYIYKTYFNLKCKIIRPFNVYGHGMKKNDERIIPTFINKIHKSKSLTVFDNGKQMRSYCHIYDAIVMIINIIFNGNKFVYNVGNGFEEISAIKLAGKMKKLLKSKVNVKKIKYPKKYPEDEPRRRCPDLSSIYSEFNYKPKVSLSEGIINTYKFLTNNKTT